MQSCGAHDEYNMPYTTPHQWRASHFFNVDPPPSLNLNDDNSLRTEIRLIQRWLCARFIYLSEYGNENGTGAHPQEPVATFMQRLDADQVQFNLTQVREAIPLIKLLRACGVKPHSSYSLKHKLEKAMST